MSWDISLVLDGGAGKDVEVKDWNYTYNVAPMFYDAFPIEPVIHRMRAAAEAGDADAQTMCVLFDEQHKTHEDEARALLEADRVFCGHRVVESGKFAVADRHTPDFAETGIRSLNGLAAPDAAEILAVAIDRMEKSPDKYKAMNPDNGWGDYGGALDLLTSIRRACLEYPKGKITVH